MQPRTRTAAVKATARKCAAVGLIVATMPTDPGAMTPAQLTRRVFTAVATATTTAAIIAAMLTAMLIFN